MSRDTDHHAAQPAPTTDTSRSLAEWTTLAISLAIVLGVVALVLTLSIADGAKPPVIVVEPRLDGVRQEADRYYLPVVVRNEGSDTVEDAMIEVELDLGEDEPETAELTVVFLAGGEEAKGTVVFTADPRTGELTARAVSFLEP